MAWNVGKVDDDVFLFINGKKAIDGSSGDELPKLRSVDTGRTADEIWIKFDSFSSGKRLLRTKYTKDDPLSDCASNRQFLENLKEKYGLPGHEKKRKGIGKPTTTVQMPMLPSVYEISDPPATPETEEIMVFNSKLLGLYTVNIFLLEIPPLEYRCREVKRSWVKEIKDNIRLAPGGHVTTLPVLLDPKKITEPEAFLPEMISKVGLFLLGGNHLITACKEVLTDEPENILFKKYKQVNIELYTGLTEKEAITIGNLHNSRTITQKLKFQDKVSQARKIFLQEIGEESDWKKIVAEAFGKIEKKDVSKESMSTIYSVASYSEECYEEVQRIFNFFDDAEVPQRVFKVLQGLKSTNILHYLRRVEKNNIRGITKEIEKNKKSEKLKSLFVKLTDSLDWEDAESSYPEHSQSLDDFLDINLNRSFVPESFINHCKNAQESVSLVRNESIEVEIKLSLKGKEVNDQFQSLIHKYKRKLKEEVSTIVKKSKSNNSSWDESLIVVPETQEISFAFSES